MTGGIESAHFQAYNDGRESVVGALQKKGLLDRKQQSVISSLFDRPGWSDPKRLLRGAVKEWVNVLDWPVPTRELENFADDFLYESSDRIHAPAEIDAMNAERVVLAAFVLAAAACGLYQLHRTQREDRTGRNAQPRPRRQDVPSRHDNILVLAISVNRNEELIAALAREGLRYRNAEEVVGRTRAVWTGSEAAFKNSPLQLLFTKREMHRTASDNTDICLVFIRTKRPLAGYEKGGSRLARIDTLRRLTQDDDRVPVEVSDRLPVYVLDGAGTYT